MNAIEQRQRHTAVQTAERRIDDLDLVIQALSMEIVQYRELFGETLEREKQTRRAVIDDLRTGIAADRAYLEDSLERERQARQADRLTARHDHHAFVSMTFWQRFSWFVFGS